ncbi:MAG: DNA polymerase III subunit beta [Lachnospiraceae bacterium]|nr:DNA polymerase III subunit beta [Lachnospiraceae bacterium]MBO7531548.1 DNA polymerase III subunit beta [Lachnospiraceae bacterium]MBP5555082.1 DNA polymerase III subunit beta [Lachnospiraceae bacterium]MBP5762104.1 DNA polymerase III subunit beta [Lachnospiraceae bacterium]
MKISCSKSALLSGIQTVIRALPAKSTMSIMECILINTNGGKITLTVNNLDLGIETIIEGNIESSGVVALDAKHFSDVIRKMPDSDSDIVIETDDNLTAFFRCEQSVQNMPGRSDDEFPYLPDLEKSDSIVISQLSLRELIRKTSFSIADISEDTPGQQTMRGELMEIKDNNIRMCSLDGHRISMCNMELRESYPYKKVIVPGKSLKELAKIIGGGAEDDVEIFFNPNHISFEYDNTKVVSRIIEGNFFDVNKMLVGDYETKVKINKKKLNECLDRSTIYVREGDKKPIILDIKDDSISIKINSAIGSMNENVPASKSGKDMIIGFNPRFVIDALNVIDDEEIELDFVNSKAPCFIKKEDMSYVYVVLPVTISAV